jgi:hypothetical protein
MLLESMSVILQRATSMFGGRMWTDVFRGLLANTIFTIGLAIVSLLSMAVFSLSRRRKFKRFFAVGRTDQVAVFLPGVNVKEFDDRAVPSGEIEAWMAINKEMREHQLSKAVNWLLSHIFNEQFAVRIPELRSCVVDVKWSTNEARSFLEGKQVTTICLGGPLSNVVVQFLMEKQSRFRIPLKKEGGYTKLAHKFGKLVLDRSKTLYEPKGWEDDFAVVEKLVYKNRTVFILAGRGRNGVFQAANYLMREWQKIAMKSRGGSFAYAWRVKAAVSDHLVYSRPRSFLCREVEERGIYHRD